MNTTVTKLKKMLGAENMNRYSLEKLKEQLIVVHNVSGQLTDWLDQVFPPQIRTERMNHWLQVSAPLIIAAALALLVLIEHRNFKKQTDFDPINGELHVHENICSYFNEVEPGQSHSCSLNTEDVRSDDNGNCIISEREKLKETDEYKRAMEEEWASRQRALQLQAEEAQELRRLRRRKKAESSRLREMERRQKQRLKEIRETQKKDEEKMNLKEVIRAEVRKELSKLEVTCHDMTSVLRGLGILVGGGLHPLLNEVRSAYKQALLTFHPDRASKSDIRQQVEAEEKFKLISRMKDKFLPF